MNESDFLRKRGNIFEFVVPQICGNN